MKKTLAKNTDPQINLTSALLRNCTDAAARNFTTALKLRKQHIQDVLNKNEVEASASEMAMIRFKSNSGSKCERGRPGQLTSFEQTLR